MQVIRKVLVKSFIQWFWELNLCSYKIRVDWFDSLLLFLLSLLNWKSRNITKHLKCYYDQILDYHFFSLDWQFSAWSTWCTNYGFIQLRKVVFFCAQKPLIFARHYNAVFLWPVYQEHKTIALWRHFLNTAHTAWQISWKKPAQTKFPFLPLRCVLV